MRKNHFNIVVVVVLLVLAGWCRAELRLPHVFGDHMVLQQETQAPVWGWAHPGEAITVKGSWDKAAVSTATAGKSGRWRLMLPTPAAGGPYVVQVAGEDEEIVLEDVLVGEVWLCSGQSNMEMPLASTSNAYTGILNYEQEIAEADYPKIRLYQVGNFASNVPREDVQPGVDIYGLAPSTRTWKPCRPQTVAQFSSAGYFFARELQQKLDVPIGMIDATWGGTRIEAWMSGATLKELGLEKGLQALLEKPNDPMAKNAASVLYNGMIHPVAPYALKGVLWYQGESNIGRAGEYERLFKSMISGWRKDFDRDFSFYFVQLAPFNYNNDLVCLLREAQRKTLRLAKTGMAVTTDIGDMQDIHPKNKQEVGRRLALWALANDYGGDDVVCSGPLYFDMKVQGNKVRLRFTHTGSGLVAQGDALTGFTIAGADKNFVPADAVIADDVVVVSSPEVAEPVAVRFGWSKEAQPSLFNKEGLPASPFRTDDWEMQPKQ